MDRRMISVFFLGLLASAFAADCFFDNIASLASSDIRLYSRQSEKLRLIKTAPKSLYLEKLRNIKSSGRTFSSGHTRGWIAEVLQGLSPQYDELKIKTEQGWPAAGYLNVTGQKVITLFDQHLSSANRILYKFQFFGVFDHAWIVEQLPYGGGYRVYQSYSSAYSLKAWLAKDNLMTLRGTDITPWHNVIMFAGNMLKAFNSSLSNLDQLPPMLLPIKPWLLHLQNLTVTQVEADLRKAWTVLGQGRVMNKDYFYDNYLKKLANMTEAIVPLVGTYSTWTKELQDQWTELFGTPYQYLYPGVPFGSVTSMFPKGYALQVKPLVFSSSDEGNCSSNAKILHDSLADCFFDNIKKLSDYDELLYSRHDRKIQLVKSGASLPQFLTVMTKVKSSGQTFACGYTRSWIAEILQGLSSQYYELKAKFTNGSLQAGFVNASNYRLFGIIHNNVNSTKRILYKFQIVGPLDHVWMVEQLPYGGGYRVYQSYNNAYSLKAWLSTGDLVALRGTDIIIWHDVIKMADNMLKAANASLSDLDHLPPQFAPLKPWLVHIRDYNLTQVEAEFRKAWTVFGQGRIMDQGYFYNNYLRKLLNLTESIAPLVSTTKPWTKELHEMWTELFGAPNPVLYPGYPFNTLTKQFSQNYALEVKVLAINANYERKCAYNAKILQESLTDCFFDSVKNLSWFDRLLNSRLEEKTRLIKSGTAKEQWLNIMRTIKSSGKTYSCGFTRSWISEILQGLPNQYTELTKKNNSGTQEAGFVNVTGSKVIDVFSRNAGSAERILYKFQIVGPLDHVWLVEQLAYGGGYRVYQSYNNAYSLKAWLAKKDHDKMLGSDIMVWHDVVRMASQFLKLHGGSMSDLNNLPSHLVAMKPWLLFIKNYNLSQVDANLKKAWSKFGQGKIIAKDVFFTNYLYTLGNLTEAIIPLVSTTKSWTQELHDKWILLFGSPNPVLYPGFPFNQLTSQYSQRYALEVKELKINDSASPGQDSIAEANCRANADIIQKSLHCFVDGIKELSSSEMLLNSRLNEKRRLIRRGVNQSEFIWDMKNFKPVNQSFAGDYMSDWIQEILQGLPSQYNDMVKQNQGNMSDFANVTGQQLLDIFTKNTGSWKRILYHFRIASYVQNVWLVEQLAFGRGYRVYMSNADAFSIKAWLASTEIDLKTLQGRDVLVWTNAIRKSNDFLKQYNASLTNLGNVPAQFIQWMESIRDYNISHADRNLQKAWTPFGKGAIISKAVFFGQYLAMLRKLTDSLAAISGTSNHWTKELQEDWIKLFGSPNPMVYPGLPYNTYSRGASLKHPLTVRVIPIEELSEASCPANMVLLRAFVTTGTTTQTPRPTWTVSTPKPTLKVHDNAAGLRSWPSVVGFVIILTLIRIF